MEAAQTVESIIKAGLITKAAFEKARASDGTVDWPKFTRSAEFETARASVADLLEQLTQDDVSKAVQRIRKKQSDFLRGREISQLPFEELLQFSQLADAEGVLVREEMKQLSSNANFLSWLVSDALPVLVKVAKVVIPILV
jgi:hypothetical protein